jgi:hypothetical protein
MIAHLHVDLFVEETPMEKTETTPTPVAAKITLIKLQYVTKMGGDQNKKNQQRSLSDIGQQMYPLLSGIYGDEFDPFDHEIQE